MAVLRRSIGGSRVAPQTEPIARHSPFETVRIMAVAAGHPAGEHLALAEGSVFVDLIFDLAVGMVEPAIEQRDEMRVGERAAWQPVFGKLGTTGMAAAAGLEFRTQGQRGAPSHLVASLVDS